MQDSRRWKTKICITIAMVLVVFGGFSLNSSLQATLCDSEIYTVSNSNNNCIDSCKAEGRSKCNAKFGNDDNGNPCTNWGDSHVHQADGNGDGTCSCIMSCEVSNCYENEEDCPL